MAGAAPTTPWPKGYEALDPLPDLLRQAIERQGPEALAVLLKHPRWAADRGFAEPALGTAWDQPQAPVDSEADATALAAALERGERPLALRLGARAAALA